VTQSAKTVDLIQDQFFKVRVLLGQNLLPVFSSLRRPLLKHCHLGHYDTHAAVSIWVAVDQALGDVVRLDEDIFNLFRCHILSLRQLENVLAAIEDSDSAIRVDYTDVTSV